MVLFDQAAAAPLGEARGGVGTFPAAHGLVENWKGPHKCVCVHVYIYIYVYTNVNIHICKYAHVYIHTYVRII